MIKRGLVKEHRATLGLFLRVLDFALIPLCGLAAYALYPGNWPLPWRYENAVLFALLLALIIFPAARVFETWRGESIFRELARLGLAWALVIAGTLSVIFLQKAGEEYSRLWMATWAGTTFIAIAVTHVALRLVLIALRKRRYNNRSVVLVGAGEHGANVAGHLKSSPWAGLTPIAFVDDDAELLGHSIEGVPVVGNLDALFDLFSTERFDEVWLTLPLSAQDRLDNLLLELRKLPVAVRFVPDIFGFRLLNHALIDFSGMPVVDLSVSPMQGLNRFLKRAEDLILGSIFLVLLAPLGLLIAIAVKLTSDGPVLFRQYRHGWDGRKIKVYKFRTMYQHHEAKGTVTQATREDSRITPLGRFLRRTSLDELPQFYNVLQGRMSIVGPRPHACEHTREYSAQIDDYMQRLRVKPGITGWAQAHGLRGETDSLDKMRRRVEYDLYYIENWSLWLDLRIIAMTIVRVAAGTNAY